MSTKQDVVLLGPSLCFEKSQYGSRVHPHVEALFVDPTMLGEIVRFIRGEAIATLPHLERVRAKYAFVPSSEVPVERMHAVVSRTIRLSSQPSLPTFLLWHSDVASLSNRYWPSLAIWLARSNSTAKR